MSTGTSATLEAEFEAATDGAGLFDRSDRGKIAVTGDDAVDFLQGQVTNDIEKLQPGSGCYAALLDPKAKILGDARVLEVEPNRLMLDTEAVALAAVLADLRMYKIGRKVEIEDLTAAQGLIGLVGPHSAQIATAASDGAEIPAHENGFVEAEISGRETLLIRTAVGVDAMCDAAAADAVEAALVAAGAVPVAPAVAETIRIERGIPRYGIDMTSENLPGEAGIVERAVSFEKGCYVGQEPVARMFHKGHPNRHLRGISFSEPVAAGAELSNGERAVGRATSTTESPRLGPIGLGILRREVEPGDVLEVAGSPARATVIELPF